MDLSSPFSTTNSKNTAGRENTLTLSGGYKGKHAITRVTWSRYHLNAGIFCREQQESREVIHYKMMATEEISEFQNRKSPIKG
jgi:hypothetical protein